MEEAKPIAYGPLQLTPDQFYRLTPAEFRELVEGWEWREDYQLQTIALIVSHVVQPHIKKKLTPKKLYDGWTRRERTREAMESDFAEMMRRHRMRQASELSARALEKRRTS